MIRVKALSGFRWWDAKRGAMMDVFKGMEVDIDDLEQKMDCAQLLQSGRVVLADDHLPAEGTYIATRTFAENFEGKLIRGKKEENITLGRDVAFHLMLSGHIRREFDTQWNPRQIMRTGVSDKEPKKMFDEDPLPPKENWVKMGGRK
jgi:hypothetical protein